MSERYECPSAVVVAILRAGDDGKEEILLQKRKNTGFADGLWDLSASGHVEEGENCLEAAVRELREETGVETVWSSLNFMGLVHKKDKNDAGEDLVYYNVYFWVSATNVRGIPEIPEFDKDKIEELRWFPLNALPDDLIKDRARLFKSWTLGHKVHCMTSGWEVQ